MRWDGARPLYSLNIQQKRPGQPAQQLPTPVVAAQPMMRVAVKSDTALGDLYRLRNMSTFMNLVKVELRDAEVRDPFVV